LNYTPIAEFETNHIYDVDAVGFGLFLIKPEIITELYNKYGDKTFEFAIRNGLMIGEDVGHCELIKELGYKIHLNTGVIIGHSSNIILDTELAVYFNEQVIKKKELMDNAGKSTV
jgi:hypothetical protein